MLNAASVISMQCLLGVSVVAIKKKLDYCDKLSLAQQQTASVCLNS